MTWIRRLIAYLRPPEVAKTAETVAQAKQLRRDLREMRRFELVIRRR